MSTIQADVLFQRLPAYFKILINRMRNLHQIILQEYGLEVQCLLRDWERLWLRASDYKNHRIFTLRCLHKDLVPVSIKLKSTLKTERAKKIVRKAEKDLIQARIKAINSILDNVGKQTELCRSKLASIISTQRLRECQGFVDKVSEIRFNKVKQRQLNKFQNLVNKKGGNITRVSNNNSPQAGNNLVANRQAGTHLPSGEGSNTPQAGPLLSPREGVGPRASQAGLGAHLLSREGSNTPQAGPLLSPREGVGPRASQAGLGAHLLSREDSNTPQAGPLLSPREGDGPKASQAVLNAHLPSGEGSNSPPQATAHLPPREGSSISQAIAHLPSGEGSNSSQATAHLPSREGSGSSQATAHLPTGEAGSSPQATAHLPTREGSSTSQATPHPSSGEGSSHSQAGQAGNQARSGRQGFRHSTRHRAPQAPQENSAASQADSTSSQEGNTTPTLPNRLPQGSSNEDPNPKWVINLSSKPLTPPQRSVLAKGPNLAVSPQHTPNLEYITAIEAACTKLSQQDVVEIRADINRVIRSSHPQTQPNQSSKLSFKGTKKGQGPHRSYC